MAISYRRLINGTVEGETSCQDCEPIFLSYKAIECGGKGVEFLVGVNTGFNNGQPVNITNQYSIAQVVNVRANATSTPFCATITGFDFANDNHIAYIDIQSGPFANCTACEDDSITYETLLLCYHATDATQLCCGGASPVTVFVASGETFENNTGLFSENTLTNAAPNGFYSNDLTCN